MNNTDAPTRKNYAQRSMCEKIYLNASNRRRARVGVCVGKLCNAIRIYSCHTHCGQCRTQSNHDQHQSNLFIYKSVYQRISTANTQADLYIGVRHARTCWYFPHAHTRTLSLRLLLLLLLNSVLLFVRSVWCSTIVVVGKTE